MIRILAAAALLAIGGVAVAFVQPQLSAAHQDALRAAIAQKRLAGFAAQFRARYGVEN